MSKCDMGCSCWPTDIKHSANPDTECTCDDCYQSGFHCGCGHETCLSPYGNKKGGADYEQMEQA